jgi:Domain of unknown function (DUF1996)
VQSVEFIATHDDDIDSLRSVIASLSRHPVGLPAPVTAELLRPTRARSNNDHASTPSTSGDVLPLRVRVLLRFRHDETLVMDALRDTSIPKRRLFAGDIRGRPNGEERDLYGPLQRRGSSEPGSATMKVRFAAMTAAAMLFAGQCSQSEFLNDSLPEPAQQKEGTTEGAFRMACRGGHLSYDDPIVAPGVDNATHLHQFFGNLDTSESTTDESIRYMVGGSTCQGGRLNGTAYWVPALTDATTQQVVPIDVVIVYYKGEPHHTAGPVQPLPEGIRMITDDSSWSCDGTSMGDTIGANCAGQLLATVRFKFCWNGQLDSPDHRSHLAASFWARQPIPRSSRASRTTSSTTRRAWDRRRVSRCRVTTTRR